MKRKKRVAGTTWNLVDVEVVTERIIGAAMEVSTVHVAQTLNYLKAADLTVGLQWRRRRWTRMIEVTRVLT